MYTFYSIDPLLQHEKSELIKKPVVIHIGELANGCAKQFAEEMQSATETGQPVIPVIINSYGGSVEILWALLDTIRNSPLPVATITTSHAMSAGFVLLTAGQKGLRFAGPNTSIMIHEAWQSIGGKATDAINNAKELERASRESLQIAARNCGHKKDYFIQLLTKKKNVDIYLTAFEAKKHNIVDHIGTPNFNVKISVDIQFDSGSR